MKKNRITPPLSISDYWIKKTLRTMKLIVLLSCTTLFSVYALDTYSQDTEISLKMKSVTVENVLREIENNSDYFFLYNNRLINVSRKVDVNFKNRKIRDILDELFKIYINFS